MSVQRLCAVAMASSFFALAARAASPETASRQSTTQPASRPASRPAAEGVHSFRVKDIDGVERSLAEYRGKVLLIVNVASKCGYTRQYAGLEKLYQRYKDKGLVVLGVPSNDFGGQEPGTNTQIKEFCSTRYQVTFPLLTKVSVAKGPEQAPLYRYLTSKTENGRLDAIVAWNFNKFLVGRDGRPIRHYPSRVTPEDEELRRAIEAALAQKAP